MKKITRLIFSSLVLAGILFTACKNQNTKKEVVGVLLRNDNETFLNTFKNGLEKAAKENNIPIQVYSANNDAAIQIDQLKTMLLNGVKSFVIIAYGTDLTEQMAKIINSQGGAAAFSNVIPSVEALKVGKNLFFIVVLILHGFARALVTFELPLRKARVSRQSMEAWETFFHRKFLVLPQK